ncbi:HAD family hydrolase [Sphingobacterium thalpophilum]|uniref:HAD family hydrolase n=1 Tax=Sphingobacterium thalpophilum TaxID=259 RepID=UPI003D963CDD
MIEAVIFDMDGVLIDSEPFWLAAEREVIGSLGIIVTEEQSSITSRMTTREVTQYWFAIQPWLERSLADVEHHVIMRVAELVDLYGEIMPGVEQTLNYFKQEGYKIGLATNSPGILVPRILKKTGIEGYFSSILTADSVNIGKPDPRIYLKSASSLSVSPSKCLVFEDSQGGVTAAVNAGMAVIAVSGKYTDIHGNFDQADRWISNLLDFCPEYIEIINRRFS